MNLIHRYTLPFSSRFSSLGVASIDLSSSSAADCPHFCNSVGILARPARRSFSDLPARFSRAGHCRNIHLIGRCGGSFAITVGPRIFREAEKLVRELPTLMESVGSGQIAQQFGSQRGWDDETQLQVQRFLIGHRDDITRAVPPIFLFERSWASTRIRQRPSHPDP
jgi:hypothetical protein